MKWIINLSLRRIFYLSAGIALMVLAIINKDILTGVFSILFFIQGIFNICLFGGCRIPQKNKR